MTKERIENAIEIINYAIQNNISVKESSIKGGYADTYIKNIKMVLLEKYENSTIEDELFSFFMDAYKKYENNRKNDSQLKIEYDKESDERKFDKRGYEIKQPSLGTPQTKFTQDGDKAKIESTFLFSTRGISHIKTLADLLRECKVDMKIWRVKNHVVNKWDVTSWKSGKPETLQNFQVKIWLERINELYKVDVVSNIFKEMVQGYIPPTLKIYPIKQQFPPANLEKENNLFEISIFDLHLGKLAWGGETGENYDTKIARKRFLNAIENLLYRGNGFYYKKILFPIGNDFFNSDTIFNTTTQGTQQDEDLRWQKTFKIGTRLIVDAINLLKQTGIPIDVMVIQGNHDFERSFYLGEYVSAWFNTDAQVSVNNGASPRKYYRFGDVLLGFTHGSEEKEASLPLLMATDIESKPMWSQTKYHEWHIGHIHRKKNVKYTVLDKSRTLHEDLGVTVRYLSSLTGTEEWHHKKGFVGSLKAAEAFIWNDKAGLIATISSNLVI